MASKNDIERHFGAIIFMFFMDIIGLLSKFGFSLFDCSEKIQIPFIIGLVIVVMIILHFIPEEVYDYYEENPALFYAIYIVEAVFLFVFMIPGHFEILHKNN